MKKLIRKLWGFKGVIVIILAFICALIFIIQDFKRDITSEDLIKELSNISVSEIKHLDIILEGAEKEIVLSNELINSQESKVLFKDAMNDLQSFPVGRYYHHRELKIRMLDSEGNLYEYETWLMKIDKKKETAYLRVAKISKDNGKFQSLGAWKSDGLCKWREFVNY